MPTKWYEAKVVNIEQLNKSTNQFTVELMCDESFEYLPGQFMTMDLPVSDKRLHRWRSYSIASYEPSNRLEFCIVKSDEGLGTQYLFEEVKVGTILKLKGPDGNFVLPTNLDQEIIMLCTGTGVAPFRSIINYIRCHNLPFRKIHLIFGTRSFDTILYKEEFESFASENNCFDYDIALSRESDSPYYHGYIHDIYMEKYGLLNPNRHFYICGWSKMIDEAVANLYVKLGYDRSQLHYELYG